MVGADVRLVTKSDQQQLDYYPFALVCPEEVKRLVVSDTTIQKRYSFTVVDVNWQRLCSIIILQDHALAEHSICCGVIVYIGIDVARTQLRSNGVQFITGGNRR